MPPASLIALPVYNEAVHVAPVLDEVLSYCQDVLVVDEYILKEGEVWVHFEKFQRDKAEKIPIG